MCSGASLHLPDRQGDDLRSEHQVDRLQQQRSAVCVCLRVLLFVLVLMCVCVLRLLHTHLHAGRRAGERHGVSARAQSADGHQPRP